MLVARHAAATTVVFAPGAAEQRAMGTDLMSRDNLDSRSVDNVLDPAAPGLTAASLGI